MKTTGVRIEVSQNFYSKLLKEQEKQRTLSGTKPSLSALILKYSEWGFVQQNEMGTTLITEQHAKQKNVDPDQARSNILSSKERELQVKEIEINSREYDIRAREYALIEKSTIINETAESLMEQRNDIYDQKEIIQQKSSEAIIFKIHKDYFEKTLEEKNEQIIHLRQELNDMKDNIYKAISKIDKKTESNTFMKFILPILPVIATVVSTYILKDKAQSDENFTQTEKDILKSFNEMNEKDQEEIKKYVKDIQNKSGKKK